MLPVTKRSLLVLGASRYQLGTIETAKRLGYHVICSDNVPSNPGHVLADKSYFIDTTDRERILALARNEKVAGVISPCTDVAVTTGAFVAQHLGLSAPPLDAAEIVCDKLIFRQFLKSKGFPVPPFFVLPGAPRLNGSSFGKRPWIIKPTRSSGSKGAFIVGSLQDLEACLPETLEFSANGRAVLEEFIEGFQGTCEGILNDGKVVLACLLDRQTAAAPYVATSGHRVPTSLPVETQRLIITALQDLWQLLGVTEAVFDCDFVVSGKQVFILEMSPRLGGNCIASLILKSSGFDFVEYAIRLVCNESLKLPDALVLHPMAVMILGASDDGRLDYDERAVDALAQTNWIDSLSMDIAVGSRVEAFTNGRRRIGECFLRGSSYEDVCAKSDQVLRRLQIMAS